MRARSAFRGGIRRLTVRVTLAATLLAFQAQLGHAAEEHQGREVRGLVQDEVGNQPAFLHVLCWIKGPERALQQWGTSNDKGEFVILAPNDAQSLSCWISGNDIYETYHDDSAIDANGKTVLHLDRKTIAILGGVMTTPRGKPIPNVLVEVQDTPGTSFRTQANDKGEFQFKNLKAGRAQVVKYTAEGYAEASHAPLDLSERSNLSMVLQPRPTPFGLLLLLPGIVVLAWWAYTGRGHGHIFPAEPLDPESPEEERSDPNAWLLIVSLGLWGLVFFGLWLWMNIRRIESLTFFDTNLSFSLFVPVCGFLGALVFAIDLVQQKHPSINTFRELAMRVLLAPYVAMIIVSFFGGTFTFIQLTNLESQAALAFFSGFLVVLFLQGLTERGNELLGQWRSSNRYEPSEIALAFKLGMEEDLKLRKANLKYLAQLQALPEADLRVLGRQTDLGEGLLVALQRQLSPDYVQAQLSPETWLLLHQEGVKTIWDVALLTPEHLEHIAKNQQMDVEVLTRFHQKCQAFVKRDQQ
jgi:Carboxypeptidase regulatory-like domain